MNEQLMQQIQQELNDIGEKQSKILVEWYGKPRCKEKEDAKLMLGELLDYRNTLLTRAKELGYGYAPEEISKTQYRYVLLEKKED